MKSPVLGCTPQNQPRPKPSHRSQRPGSNQMLRYHKKAATAHARTTRAPFSHIQGTGFKAQTLRQKSNPRSGHAIMKTCFDMFSTRELNTSLGSVEHVKTKVCEVLKICDLKGPFVFATNSCSLKFHLPPRRAKANQLHAVCLIWSLQTRHCTHYSCASLDMGLQAA